MAKPGRKPRDPYSIVGAAWRDVVSEAAALRPRLTSAEWATLSAILALTAGYSRLSDRLSVLSEIAPTAGISDRAARNAVRRLAELGLVDVAASEGRKAVYTIPTPEHRVPGSETTNPGTQRAEVGALGTSECRGTPEHCVPGTPEHCVPDYREVVREEFREGEAATSPQPALRASTDVDVSDAERAENIRRISELSSSVLGRSVE